MGSDDDNVPPAAVGFVLVAAGTRKLIEKKKVSSQLGGKLLPAKL